MVPQLELLHTLTAAHPVQANYDDHVEYVVTHNLGKRPMKFELIMHRDNNSVLRYTTNPGTLSNVAEQGAFSVSSIGLGTLKLSIYKAGLFYETEDFTFNIYG